MLHRTDSLDDISALSWLSGVLSQPSADSIPGRIQSSSFLIGTSVAPRSTPVFFSDQNRSDIFDFCIHQQHACLRYSDHSNIRFSCHNISQPRLTRHFHHCDFIFHQISRCLAEKESLSAERVAPRRLRGRLRSPTAQRLVCRSVLRRSSA